MPSEQVAESPTSSTEFYGCDETGGGCGDDISAHPVKVVNDQFTSRCQVPGCRCEGFVTPMPNPDGSHRVAWKVAA